MDEIDVQRLNDAIRNGHVRNMLQEPIGRELDGGLIDSTGQFVYPIRDGIPVLMRDEAIQVGDVLSVNDVPDNPIED